MKHENEKVMNNILSMNNTASIKETNRLNMTEVSISQEEILHVVQELIQRGKSVVLLKGNVGRDATYVPNTDGKLAKFTLAVDQYTYTPRALTLDKSGNLKKETGWYDIEVRRGKINKVLEQVSKGKSLTLIGQLRKRSYVNRLGQSINDTSVVLNEFWINAA